MEAATAAAAIHPEGEALDAAPGREARTVGWLCAGTGLALVGAMGLLGLTMRLTQAEVLGVSPEWFYRIMTLHGAGMLAGALLAMMGGLWYVTRASAPLDFGRMLFSYASIVVGAVVVVVAVILGGFGTGWTFLAPLPFSSFGAWPEWATATFFAGMALVGVGFFVFCIDVLGAVTRAYGGLGRALGLPLLRDRDAEVPPPQVVAATAITAQGMLASAVGTTILIALLGRTIDSAVALDALWAKNLTYFFGHSVANLIIYLAAGMIYVLLPRYAGRPWKTTLPLVIGWVGTLVFVTTAYFHHLYMDFAQPQAVQWVGMAASSGAAIPVAVVTIYTGMMLVWGSRLRWTLASVLIYLGFAGLGDRRRRRGDRLADPGQLPLPQHALGPGALPHLPDGRGGVLGDGVPDPHARARGRTRGGSGRERLRTGRDGDRRLRPARLLVRIRGARAATPVRGPLGSVPRRGDLQHRRQRVRRRLRDRLRGAVVGARAPGTRCAAPSPQPDRLRLQADRRRGARPRRPARAAAQQPVADRRRRRRRHGRDVHSPSRGLRGCVANVQLHHVQHAIQFLVGAALGAALVSTPELFPARPSRRLSWTALVAVILAPVVMLLAMIPTVYGSFEGNEALHLAYHLGIVALGALAGLGASLLGRVPGRLLLALAVGMALLYAGGVTG